MNLIVRVCVCVCLTFTCVFHLVVVHQGESLHGVIDGLPLQQT